MDDAGLLDLCKNLQGRVADMRRLRGWSKDWPLLGAYLHLEVSELIEAVRGKSDDPEGEAADVLLVLMALTEANGIEFSSVLERVAIKVQELVRDRTMRPGEYHV